MEKTLANNEEIPDEVSFGNLKLKFDPKIYECTSIEFYNAVENIKDKMSIVGIEGNL